MSPFRLGRGAAVLLLAHGSPDRRHARDLAQLSRAVGDRLAAGSTVAVAYLDHHGPDPASAASALLATGMASAWVVPVFTARAYHMRVDVPAALAAMAGVGLRVTAVHPGLAGNPQLPAAALAGVPAAEPVVLFAAGSSDAAACLRLAEQVTNLRPGSAAPAAAAFLAGGPSLPTVLADLGGPARVVPFVIADGILRDRMAQATAAAGLHLTPGSLADNPAVADLIATGIPTAVTASSVA